MPPFPGATGRGVRVAVIDSGVHAGHSHIGAIAGGVAVGRDGDLDFDPSAWADRLGHGTAVTAAIREKAPGAEIHVVRVFLDSLRTSAAVLLRAIAWGVDQEMDVINLSLGSTNAAHAELFARAAAEAGRAGAILVAAREANDMPCYPGRSPGVVGVGLDWDCPRHGLRCVDVGGETVFYASGYPRPIPGVAPMRNLYGVSFAVANISGVLARALEGLPRDAGRAEAARRRLTETATADA